MVCYSLVIKGSFLCIFLIWKLDYINYILVFKLFDKMRIKNEREFFKNFKIL